MRTPAKFSESDGHHAEGIMAATASQVRHLHHERADVFLVLIPSDGIAQVAVRHIETSGDAWSIYGAISTTATLRRDRRDRVKQVVYAWVLAHPDDVDEKLIQEARRGVLAV
jgi:hypothetical protein